MRENGLPAARFSAGILLKIVVRRCLRLESVVSGGIFAGRRSCVFQWQIVLYAVYREDELLNTAKTLPQVNWDNTCSQAEIMLRCLNTVCAAHKTAQYSDTATDMFIKISFLVR